MKLLPVRRLFIQTLINIPKSQWYKNGLYSVYFTKKLKINQIKPFSNSVTISNQMSFLYKWMCTYLNSRHDLRIKQSYSCWYYSLKDAKIGFFLYVNNLNNILLSTRCPCFPYFVDSRWHIHYLIYAQTYWENFFFRSAYYPLRIW